MAERIPVAVTGYSVATALGPDTESTWAAVERGERAVRYERPCIEERLRQLGAPAYIPLFESNLAGIMHGFDFRADERIAEAVKPKDVDRFYCETAQIFIAAAVQAGTMAGIFEGDSLVVDGDQWRNSVVVGSGAGGTSEMGGFAIQMQHGDKRLPPYSLPINQPENAMVVSSQLFQTKRN